MIINVQLFRQTHKSDVSLENELLISECTYVHYSWSSRYLLPGEAPTVLAYNIATSLCGNSNNLYVVSNMCLFQTLHRMVVVVMLTVAFAVVWCVLSSVCSQFVLQFAGVA